MATFQLFINDDRYSVPTLRFLTAPSGLRACELAERALQESPHHLGVELYRSDRRLFSRGSRFRTAPPGPEVAA